MNLYFDLDTNMYYCMRNRIETSFIVHDDAKLPSECKRRAEWLLVEKLGLAIGTIWSQNTWSGNLNLNDTLLDLACYKTQSNWSNRWTDKAFFHLPAIFSQAPVTQKIWRHGNDHSITASKLILVDNIHLSRFLWYYYWPIRCGHYFSNSWTMRQLKSALDW